MVRTNVNPYGAMELKLYYQRNMLLGTIVIAAIALAGIGAALLGTSAGDIIVIDPNRHVDTVSVTIVPPPTIIRPLIPTLPGNAPAISSRVGIPVPVADDAMIDDDVSIATGDQLAMINSDSIPDIGNGSGNIVIDIPDQPVVEYPEINDWVPYQHLPEMIYEAVPDYPRLARQAGMEASVWIKALVDKKGNVIKAVVFKFSGSKAGFDEAAVAAAFSCKYKPAVQNGYPVPAWVTYKVEFILNK